MHRLDETNAASWLTSHGHISDDETVSVRELAGGVSNVVLYVDRSGGDSFVLKQCREQLRVPQPWFCSVERIWREVAVLKYCSEVLKQNDHAIAAGRADNAVVNTPDVLFEDRDDYAFGMTAAPADHAVWKTELLAGRAERAIAAACGRLLGRLHGTSWQDSDAADRLGDATFFEDLRVDPYYRQIGRIHADLAHEIGGLIRSLDENRVAFVHGDFSPKNLLVFPGGLMMIDFEVGHFGDPAFDLGFFLSHLFLKAIRAGTDADAYLRLVQTFCDAYYRSLDSHVQADDVGSLTTRGVANLAGCLLARVDGKSRVDYLSERQQRLARQLARRLFSGEAADWTCAVELARESIELASSG